MGLADYGELDLVEDLAFNLRELGKSRFSFAERLALPSVSSEIHVRCPEMHLRLSMGTGTECHELWLALDRNGTL